MNGIASPLGALVGKTHTGWEKEEWAIFFNDGGAYTPSKTARKNNEQLTTNLAKLRKKIKDSIASRQKLIKQHIEKIASEELEMVARKKKKKKVSSKNIILGTKSHEHSDDDEHFVTTGKAVSRATNEGGNRCRVIGGDDSGSDSEELRNAGTETKGPIDEKNMGSKLAARCRELEKKQWMSSFCVKNNTVLPIQAKSFLKDYASKSYDSTSDLRMVCQSMTLCPHQHSHLPSEMGLGNVMDVSNDNQFLNMIAKQVYNGHGTTLTNIDETTTLMEDNRQIGCTLLMPINNDCLLPANTNINGKSASAYIVIPLLDDDLDNVTLKMSAPKSEEQSNREDDICVPLDHDKVYAIKCKNPGKKCGPKRYCAMHTLQKRPCSSLSKHSKSKLMVFMYFDTDDLIEPDDQSEETDDFIKCGLVFEDIYFGPSDNIGKGYCLYLSLCDFINSVDKDERPKEWNVLHDIHNVKQLTKSKFFTQFGDFITTSLADEKAKKSILAIAEHFAPKIRYWERKLVQSLHILEAKNQNNWPGFFHIHLLSLWLKMRIIVISNEYDGLGSSDTCDSMYADKGIPEKNPTCTIYYYQQEKPTSSHHKNQFNHFCALLQDYQNVLPREDAYRGNKILGKLRDRSNLEYWHPQKMSN